MKLLVPVDGSDNSMRALRHAIALAKAIPSSSIHVVTAHDEPIVFGEVAVYVSREKIAELQRKQSEGPLSMAVQALEAAGISHSKEIIEGSIANTIAHRADELGCDGIVMGTRGMTALGGLLLGSVATRVIHAATVPVTLVK
ncbi:MAG: universal stress protein [Deltaproteobacteria bacterium]|nr:universal stress protein [Deltaproteobacteria bacterium]